MINSIGCHGTPYGNKQKTHDVVVFFKSFRLRKLLLELNLK